LSDIHVTQELLRALARGELSTQDLAQILTHHLENLCSVCREENPGLEGGQDVSSPAEVRALAEEIVALFEARDVHREILAALVLFQEAARREEVTAAMVRELAGFLESGPLWKR
jgi:hypothetical protein